MLFRSLKYSMVTPYTSFVAVIEEVRSPEGNSKDVDQPNPLPFGVSGLSVGGGYMIGAEPNGLLLILLLSMAVLLSRTQKKRKKPCLHKSKHQP